LAFFSSRSARRCLIALCVCGSIWTLAGCGDSTGNKLVPVVGMVTVDGKPLTTGTGNVSFRPEGSASSQEPAGTIDEDGTYRLFTAGKEGAPPGRYRVLVIDVEPLDPKDPFPYGKRKSHVNEKYSNPKTSGLVVEVVPSAPPGTYDLKLTK